MTDLLFCPECQAAGQRSRVICQGSRTTTMGTSTFYDEEGRYHHHDRNKTTTGYVCSNGHTFSRVSESKCWCEA